MPLKSAKLDGVLFVVPDALGGKIEMIVNWRLIESSNVAAVGWDDAGNMYTKFGKFENPVTFVYLGVSRQRVVAAAYARSTGEYINRKIKPNYAVLKLGEGT